MWQCSSRVVLVDEYSGAQKLREALLLRLGIWYDRLVLRGVCLPAKGIVELHPISRLRLQRLCHRLIRRQHRVFLDLEVQSIQLLSIDNLYLHISWLRLLHRWMQLDLGKELSLRLYQAGFVLLESSRS